VSAVHLAAAAIQEDVVAIGLVSAADDDEVGALPDALTAYDAGDIVVFSLDEAGG
jgi:methylmalonyl-CoA mutase cobalamin-binding subunit